MNPEFLLARLKTLRESFTTPQMLSMAGAFVVVVGVIVGAAWWLNSPTYRVLFTELDPESAGRVSERLRAQEVPFQLSDGGRTILVPQERIDQLRLDFAVTGLPSQGRMGFEIFDQTQFGATEFLEQVNFRRALEGEIGRTIATIAEVSAARVHIVLPKSHVFSEAERGATASVMLTLRSGRLPSPATIQGIAGLVAAAVEGLRPESVVIMESRGRPLSNPLAAGSEALDAAQVERQHQYEQQMAKELVSLLEVVVGPGSVQALVNARLHLDSEERLDEQFGNPQIRSQDIKEQGTGGSMLSQGIPGSRGNLPGPVPPGSTQPTPTTLAASSSAPVAAPTSRSEVTNYEVSRTTIKTQRPRGGVARLSVAVVVDDEHYAEKDKNGNAVTKTRPRSQKDMEKLHDMVAAAVGFDPSRGDVITVSNMAFSSPPVDEPAPAPLLERFAPQISVGLKVLVILVLGSAAFFFVGRPLMRRHIVDARPVDEPMLPRQLPRTIEEIEGEIAAQLDSAAVQLDRRLPVLTKRLSGLAAKDPEVAARLIRTWLLEDKK